MFARTMTLHVPRTILAGFVVALALTACDPSHRNVEQVADGLYLYRSDQHRSLFMVTRDGVVVTDPINSEVAKAYREAISEYTDQPVKFVVYSHYHWDRVAGAEVFRAEGAKIIAQEQCAQRFIDNPNPAVATPDITFRDRYEIDIGGKSLGLYYFGPSHGDCLTVFLARPAKMLQIVELVNPPGASFPEDPIVPYLKPHNLRRFFVSVRKLAQDYGVKQIISSRVTESPGPDGRMERSPPVGPVSIIDAQARFWDSIDAAVEKAEAEGNVDINSFVKLETVDLSMFELYDGYKKENLPIIMRRFVGYHDMGR
jgi:hypothetical protein